MKLEDFLANCHQGTFLDVEAEALFASLNFDPIEDWYRAVPQMTGYQLWVFLTALKDRAILIPLAHAKALLNRLDGSDWKHQVLVEFISVVESLDRELMVRLVEFVQSEASDSERYGLAMALLLRLIERAWPNVTAG